MSNQITATFKTNASTNQFINRIEALGVTEEQISIVATDDTVGKSFNIEKNSKAPEGATTGAVTGGLIGAIAAGLLSAGAIAIPGLNLVVSGALVSAIAGLGAGATTGGLIGALVGAGIPEHEAKVYEDEIKNGAILISVEAKNSEQKDLIKQALEQEDAHNIAA